MFNKKKEWLNLLIVFLVAFLPRFIFVFFSVPMRVPSDEISTLAGAAYLADLNWKEAIVIAGYYGVGATSLFTPLFKLGIDSVIIYRIILIFFSIIQGLIAPIAYIIIKNYFKIENKLYTCAISIASSYLVVITTTYIYNEHIVILISWLLVLILLKLHKNNCSKTRKYYTVLLMIVLIYSLTIHTRSIVFWGGVVILLLLYRWRFRKWLISLPIAIFTGTIGYLGAKIFIHNVINTVWAVAENEIRNTKISVNGIELLCMDIKSWTSWIDIVIGQINTAAVFSGGVLIVCAIIGIRYLWFGIIKKRNVRESSTLYEEGCYFIISVFSLSMIAVTILGQSFSWLSGVYSSMIFQDYENTAFSAITYLRYFMAYAGPLFVMGSVHLYHFFKDSSLYKHTFITVSLLQVFWITSIVPYIANNENAATYFIPFSISTLLSGNVRIRTYLSASLILFLIMTFLFFLFKRGYRNIGAILICCLLVYEYCVNAILIIQVEQINYSYVNETCSKIKELEKENKTVYNLYLENSQIEKTGQSKFCLYQFMLPDHVIKKGVPTSFDEKNIILTEMMLPEEIIGNNYEMIQLDENEIIYLAK